MIACKQGLRASDEPSAWQGRRTTSIGLVAVLAAAASGCGQQVAVPARTAASAAAGREISAAASGSDFAPIAENDRRGLWLGGPPPHNKDQAGISAYYQLRSGGTADRLTMKLRFEGVVADDAVVRVSGIDGARLDPAVQRSEWRLKPNVASEITITLAVPAGPSYLTLYASQNRQGASRAFFLEGRSSPEPK